MGLIFLEAVPFGAAFFVFYRYGGVLVCEGWGVGLVFWIMIRLFFSGVVGVVFLGGGLVFGGAAGVAEKGIVYGNDVSGVRLKLVEKAEEAAKKYSHFSYKFGGASPKDGGFDCSGAMYYVLREVGLKPPRTSAQQFSWVRDAGRLTVVGDGVTSLEDKVFGKLRPGDLLFWSGTYIPTDGRKVNITHVAIYLGKEKDGRFVMANATSGRSYRGKKGDGFGIYDFKLPSKSSKSKFVGYGSPVGLADGIVAKKKESAGKVLERSRLADACDLVGLMNLRKWDEVAGLVEGDSGLEVLKLESKKKDWCGVGAYVETRMEGGDVVHAFRYGARVDSPQRVMFRYAGEKGKAKLLVLGW